MKNESGGHRWQRVSPTEKRGRVHTSTVTVAVFEEKYNKIEIDDADINVRTTKDGGPGGQHKNKTESCVIMTHEPTGISIKVDGRNQHANRREARKLLDEKINFHYQSKFKKEIDKDRYEQVGSGMRGDKIRTYREQNDRVIDHRTNRKCSLAKILKGRLDVFWGVDLVG